MNAVNQGGSKRSGVIDHRVDVSTGTAVDWDLDGAELAAVETIRAAGLRSQAQREQVRATLERLHRRAAYEPDGWLADLLMVLGL